MSCNNCGAGGRLKTGGSCVPCYGQSHSNMGHPDNHNTGAFNVDCQSCHSEGKHDATITAIKEGTVNRGNVQSAWIAYPEREKMNNQGGSHGTTCEHCRKLAGDWYK